MGGNQAIAVNLSVGIAFAAFSGIILYHIFRQIKDLSLFNSSVLFLFISKVLLQRSKLSPLRTQSVITSEVVVTSTVVPAPQHASFQFES